MADVVLTRFESTDQGTFGRIVARGLSLYSGELAWRDNRRNVSCLPQPGTHRVVWAYSPKFRRFTYLILGTEPRSGIRIHPANLCGDESRGYRKQLNGCLALGERIGWLDRQKALLLSAPAVRRFEWHMNFRPFTLEIRNG